MKLKQILLAGVAAGAANMAMAANVITFEGNILENTCQVEVGGQTSPTITLPDVGKNAFAQAGDTAGATPFTVSLTGCTVDPNDSVQVRFIANKPAGQYLGIENVVGSATNVVIQLLEGDAAGTAITFTNGIGATSPQTTNAGTASFPLTARYRATAVPVDAGTVTAIANYEVIYP